MSDSTPPPPPASRRHPNGRANGHGFGIHIGGPGGDGHGVEGILGGLSGLLKALSDLAEKGKDLQQSGGFTTKDGKEGSFQYGLNIRTLDSQGGREVRVEPFGNIKRDEATGETVVHEWREPITDVIEEDGYVQVVLEMPGVERGDLKTELSGDILSVSAERAGKRYRKEVLLPGGGAYDPAKLDVGCNSGVVQIRCAR
ncbi:MAG: Hsp20/alpha crystallin family protein [Phycisphaerales bacterium]|nr:Hsp20/alpha crystallin family protein [Phycisphaerales bacterium]